MKTWMWLVLSMSVVAYDVAAQSGGDAATEATAVTDRFPVGETLTFDAKFGIIRLGSASMQVVGVDTVRGEPAVHFRFLMDAAMLGLIRLHDQFDSWVGADDFVSRRFRQEFDEPGQKRTTSYEIFPDSGVYLQAGVDSVRPTAANPLDDTAFFYFVRTLDLEPGIRQEFDTYFRPDRNPVIIDVLARDTIDVPAGRFATVVVRPVIKGGGIFKESSDARMWISDDPRRLIVQMKSRFGFGTVTLRLTGTDGVLHADAGETS